MARTLDTTDVPPHVRGAIRPLRRVQSGVWCSRDKRWTFLRHESDPRPKRWYYYEDDEAEASNFAGCLSLDDAVREVEAFVVAEWRESQ